MHCHHDERRQLRCGHRKLAATGSAAAPFKTAATSTYVASVQYEGKLSANIGTGIGAVVGVPLVVIRGGTPVSWRYATIHGIHVPWYYTNNYKRGSGSTMAETFSGGNLTPCLGNARLWLTFAGWQKNGRT